MGDSPMSKIFRCTLKNPETNSFFVAPENGWLEDFLVSFWDEVFAGNMLVSGRVGFGLVVSYSSNLVFSWNLGSYTVNICKPKIGNSLQQKIHHRFDFFWPFFFS